jgi:plastocyanin
MRPRLLLISGSLVLLAAACGNGATTTVSPPAAMPTPPSGPMAEIRELDFRFDPTTFAIRTDQGLSITNEGQATHNFSIEGADVDLDTSAGQSTNTEAIGGIATPGTYPFFCKFHRAQGMEGTVTVVAA